MGRLVVVLAAVLVVVIGGLFLLAARAHERPPVRIEKAVNLANLQG